MQDILKRAYDPEHFREEGHRLVDLLADYLKEVSRPGTELKVTNWGEPAERHEYWLEDRRTSQQAEAGDLFREVLAQSVHLHHPRYMGHQISPAVPVAALAGMLGDFLNNGMGVYEMGSASTSIERVVTQETARRLGLGEQSDGVLTSGGSLANLTALLTARSVKGGDVWREGQRESLALMVSAEAHYCVDRAARIMGWGEEGIIKVPVDGQYRMRTDLLPEYLSHALENGRRVIAVVGSACTTSTGSYDDLAAIGEFCQAHDLWFHVDGAHGAPAAFSEKFACLVRGIEMADSVTMDFHKMLLTPSVTTGLLYRNGRHAYETFHQQGQYLWSRDETEEWYNIAKRSFECTKLMMSIKVYSLLRTYGWELFVQYVDRVIGLGRRFAAIIRQRPDLELAVEPDCNIVCFRYRPAGMNEEEADLCNEQIRRSLLEEGNFYIVQTRLRGRTWLRCTLTNPFTEEGDLKALVDEVVRCSLFVVR